MFYKDDPGRPPSAEDMQTWTETCHKICPEDLGKVLLTLEAKCSHCLVKKVDTNEVEVNVDLIPGTVFREVKAFMDQILPDATRKLKKQRTDE